MPEPTAAAHSPETWDKLRTAGATGRMLLFMLATWIEVEARPAVAAVNADIPEGISDDDLAAYSELIPGREDPDVLTDAMVTIVDAIHRTEGMTAEDWQLVAGLAGEWVPARRRPGR